METKEGLMLAVIFLLIAAIISIPNTYAATHTHTPKTTSSPPISGLTTNTPSSNTPSTPSSNTPSQPTTLSDNTKYSTNN